MTDTTSDPRAFAGANPYADPRAAQAFRLRCERLVRNLPIPAPFDEHAFCDALGARRGRPILLVAWSLRRLTAGTEVISGFVTVERERDVIFYERDTRRLHQQQIIAHEAAHLILDHRGDGVISDSLAADLSPIAPHTPIRHVHRRAGARNREEFEAETLGRMILLHASSSSAHLARIDPDAALLLDMLEGLDGLAR